MFSIDFPCPEQSFCARDDLHKWYIDLYSTACFQTYFKFDLIFYMNVLFFSIPRIMYGVKVNPFSFTLIFLVNLPRFHTLTTLRDIV